MAARSATIRFREAEHFVLGFARAQPIERPHEIDWAHVIGSDSPARGPRDLFADERQLLSRRQQLTDRIGRRRPLDPKHVHEVIALGRRWAVPNNW